MNTLSPHLYRGDATHAVLALVAAVIFIAVLTGFNERLGIGDNVAFWALFLVGMTLCARGPLGQGATYGWWNPLHLAGYVLGVVMLLLGAAIVFDVALPGIHTAQRAIVVLGVLMVVKGVLAMFYSGPAT